MSIINENYNSLIFLILVRTVLISLAILATVYNVESGCPEPHSIAPCTCHGKGGAIICSGNSTIDLVKIFETLDKSLTKSEKHFQHFRLQNSANTEFKENFFKDITFDEIVIVYNTNLTMIHPNAFPQTILNSTKRLFITGNSQLTSPDNSIYQLSTSSKISN